MCYILEICHIFLSLVLPWSAVWQTQNKLHFLDMQRILVIIANMWGAQNYGIESFQSSWRCRLFQGKTTLIIAQMWKQLSTKKDTPLEMWGLSRLMFAEKNLLWVSAVYRSDQCNFGWFIWTTLAIWVLWIPFWKLIRSGQKCLELLYLEAQNPVLKSSNHGNHGWGHTAFWGGTSGRCSKCVFLTQMCPL